MEKEKNYRIGDAINPNEIEKIAEGICIKALKVVEASGNMWACRIIEKKDVDTFEDLKMEIIVKLIENNYVISKECYRVVNKYMYNFRVHKINNVEIVVNEENNKSNINFESYITWLSESQQYYEKKPSKKACSFRLNDLKLTDRQYEILNIYSKINNFEQTAEILGVAKTTIETTINRIKAKALEHCNNIEF